MEREQAIRQGDAVRAHGDGPVMAVHVVIGRLAYCMWVEAGRLRQGAWRTEDLRPATPAPAA